MKPVLRGMMKYESLLDGSIGILDLALLHDAMDVQDENNRRLQEHLKDK